jgi:hypothetical protein
MNIASVKRVFDLMGFPRNGGNTVDLPANSGCGLRSEPLE